MRLNQKKDVGKVLAVACSNVAADNLLEGTPLPPTLHTSPSTLPLPSHHYRGLRLVSPLYTHTAPSLPFSGCLRLGLNAVRVGRAATVRPELRNFTLDAMLVNHESVSTFKTKVRVEARIISAWLLCS